MIPIRRFQTGRTKSRSGTFRLCWESLSKSMKSAGKMLAVVWLFGSVAATLLADDETGRAAESICRFRSGTMSKVCAFQSGMIKER